MGLGIVLRYGSAMDAREDVLRDRAMKRSRQWSRSDCETPVAKDQPDTDCLQVTECSIHEDVTEW